MIERTFVAQRTREYYIRKYVEKIVISTSRPSLIVGSKGANIRSLTKNLKEKFNLENPQIEINEVTNPFLNANIVAERIVSSLERFGVARFKGVGHKMMENVMNAGALGIEITISGKIPGARAKSWRFYTGYLKKCGDVALSVRIAKKSALLKSGVVGVKVAIMPPDIVLPDKIKLLEEPEQIIAPVEKEAPAAKAAPAKKKRSTKKSAKSKDETEVKAAETEKTETVTETATEAGDA